MKKISFFLFAFVLFSCVVNAQYMTAADYVAKYKDIAIREMIRMGVPAAISLAQGLLETENGNSDLVKESNNHFGIKCKSTWNARTVSHDDDAPGECFRAYKSAEDSYRDHSNFLRGSPRYAFLFKLDPRDYKAWAYGLKKAGYATNPNYPDILIKNIEDNNLEQYTDEAVDEIPVYDASRYTDDPADKELSIDNKTPQQTSDNTANNTSPDTAVVFINGCRALMVPKGTSLLAVASRYNINLNRLLQINDMDNDGLLDKDQYIFLEKKQKTGNRNFYIVQQNETLFDVAQKNGIILKSLYDYNKVSPGDPVIPGTKILLRPVEISTVASNNNNANGNNITDVNSNEQSGVKLHEVQPKESLYAISKKYSVSIDDLKEWNHLKDNNLKIGQQLIISK